ncbi:MAG TPA: hypothetical protein VFN76_10035 [Candidatus Limnocylindria bacterium]|nr:hypothetical protein [Candidatus Limnocylindria bacterium]
MPTTITYPTTTYEVRYGTREGDPSPRTVYPQAFSDRSKAQALRVRLNDLSRAETIERIDGCSWYVETVTTTSTANVPDTVTEQEHVDALERADAAVLVYVAAIPDDPTVPPAPPTPIGFVPLRALRVLVVAPPPDDATLDAIDDAVGKRPKRALPGGPGRVTQPSAPAALPADILTTTTRDPANTWRLKP